MAGASQESLVKKGPDAALHQHYGSAMVISLECVTISNAESALHMSDAEGHSNAPGDAKRVVDMLHAAH